MEWLYERAGELRYIHCKAPNGNVIPLTAAAAEAVVVRAGDGPEGGGSDERGESGKGTADD